MREMGARSAVIAVLVAVAALWWPVSAVQADGPRPAYDPPPPTTYDPHPAYDPPPSYDISWPQCPATFPSGEFTLAVIGLNNGRPFTTNDCFRSQYRWAQTAQQHPDVYVNVDFPRANARQAATGPYGQCEAGDDWCRGYNYGYATARDSLRRATALGASPGRYWLDVEVDNYWSSSTRNNAQVVRGALDYFLDFNIPVGVYATRYQWGLITGGFMPSATLPLWVAGATDRASAEARCHDASSRFAGGNTWMVQYPEGEFNGNALCAPAQNALAAALPPHLRLAVPPVERVPLPVAESRASAPASKSLFATPLLLLEIARLLPD